jgi:hypothetical protein
MKPGHVLSEPNPAATRSWRRGETDHIRPRVVGAGAWFERRQAAGCENARRRLLNHLAILEARMAILQSEMTFISSRLTKLAMQGRLERLSVQVGSRPFEEVEPASCDPLIERSSAVDVMARASDDRWLVVIDRRPVAGQAPVTATVPAGDRLMATAGD